MSKWRYECWDGEEYYIVLSKCQKDDWVYVSETAAKTIVRSHNRTCAEYEAQVAELQRRLDAVLAQFGEIECDNSCGITWTCTRCQAHARARAITEGRENG